MRRMSISISQYHHNTKALSLYTLITCLLAYGAAESKALCQDETGEDPFPKKELIHPAIQRDVEPIDNKWHHLDDPHPEEDAQTHRDVIPGQRVNLRFKWTPADGRTIKEYLWYIEGNVFKDWTANGVFSELTELEASDLEGEVVSFYWSNFPGNGNQFRVSCRVTLDDGSTETRWEPFNIHKPTVYTRPDTPKVGTIILDKKYNPLRVGLWGTHPKNPKLPYPGIYWITAVDTPEDWRLGEWNVVQVVKSSTDTITLSDTFDNEVLTYTHSNAIDGYYPMEPSPPGQTGRPTGSWRGLSGEHPGKCRSFPADKKPQFIQDTPQTITLVEDGWVHTKMENTIQTYIMFLPSGVNSRYVPLIKYDWGVTLEAKYNSDRKTWEVGSASAVTAPTKSSNKGSPGVAHPSWNDNSERLMRADMVFTKARMKEISTCGLLGIEGLFVLLFILATRLVKGKVCIRTLNRSIGVISIIALWCLLGLVSCQQVDSSGVVQNKDSSVDGAGQPANEYTLKDITLSAEFPRNNRVGEPLSIKLNILNRQNQPISYVYDRGGAFSFMVRLYDRAGQAVKRSEYGRQLFVYEGEVSCSTSSRVEEVCAGENLSVTIDLTSCFNLLQKDDYTITVSWRGFDWNGDVVKLMLRDIPLNINWVE